MRLLIQRVKHASVAIGGDVCSRIGAGLLVLLGVGCDDTDEDIEYLAGKLVRLRIFDDEAGVMNLDVVQTDGEILVVSQFTLQASTRKGNRPSYIKAAPEAVSRPLYERFTARVAELLGRGVATGEFGADMQVELVNDGPVTIWMDSKNKEYHIYIKMKKIFAFLLLGLTVAFASCGDEKTETGTDWFLTPVAEVNGTTVGLSCQTRFGEGVLENTSVGFSYAAVVDNKIGAFADVAGSAVDGTGIAATLTGLQPETSYVVFAYAGLSTGRVQSAGAVFKTGQDDMPDPDPERPAFGTPAASGVTKTEATLSCTFNFEDTADYDVYFRYKPASSGSYDRVNVPTGTGTKTAALTGLTPGTTYEFALCADWGGQTYTSAAATFTTSSDGGGGNTGSAKYSGWPELPVEVANSDYYYAYHICPDFSVGGHKARNYTVCFSAENHCPLWVSAPRHACYEVKNTDRTDAYGRDPKIPSNIQCSSKSTGGGCNKGHMLGSAERLVTREVNKQVFYYTNIAPQYSGSFNTGGGAWNNLEAFVDAQVCADTTYIVVGTYFKPFTDAYGQSCSPAKISFGGRNDVTRPSMFYYLILRTKSGSTRKSVRDCRADELKCAAFVLRHNMEKGHKPQAKDMMKVSDLEALTGFQFFANVPNAPKSSYNPSDWGL